MIIDIVCTFSATTIEAEAKSVSLVLTFPVTQAPSNICDEVKTCLGINESGNPNLVLNEQGDWVSKGGGGGSYTFENGLTEDAWTVKLGGALTENTQIDWSDKYLEIGDYNYDDDTGYGLIFGNTLGFDGELNSLVGKLDFLTIHADGEGLFLTASGLRSAPQVVWDGTRQGNENISAMTVYDEDAFIQQAILRLSFNVDTKEGYGKLSCPSDFTPDDNLHQNQFYVTNDETRLKYYHATSGEIISQKLTDDGILIEKYDSDDDPTSKVPLNQIDYNGFIYLGAESLDGSWRFATSSGNLVIEKRVAGVWVTKQTLV